MEFWEMLNERWKAAKKTNGIDYEELEHQRYLKENTFEQRAAVREALRHYNPNNHAYNGPFTDDWVSAGVSHAIDYREINHDFLYPDWERGYDI